MEQEYSNTVLRFEDGASIDLRASLDAEARARFAAHGLAERFAILSAYPAPNEARSIRESEALTARLTRVIAAFDVRPVPVLASSPDRRHLEPSVAAGLSRTDALGIARLFGQAAMFWFDGERMWIDWTDGRPPTALPEERASLSFRVHGLRAELDESGGH